MIDYNVPVSDVFSSERIYLAQPVTHVEFRQESRWAYGFENEGFGDCFFAIGQRQSGIRLRDETGNIVAYLGGIDDYRDYYYDISRFDGLVDYAGSSGVALPQTQYYQTSYATIPAYQGFLQIERYNGYRWVSTTGVGSFSVSCQVGGTLSFD